MNNRRKFLLIRMRHQHVRSLLEKLLISKPFNRSKHLRAVTHYVDKIVAHKNFQEKRKSNITSLATKIPKEIRLKLHYPSHFTCSPRKQSYIEEHPLRASQRQEVTTMGTRGGQS